MKVGGLFRVECVKGVVLFFLEYWFFNILEKVVNLFFSGFLVVFGDILDGYDWGVLGIIDMVVVY